MTCDHQQVITKVSSCVDVSGTITEENCFSKGEVSGGKCVWTSYTTKDGAQKASCGPCEVNGVGVILPTNVGSEGPEKGSTVVKTSMQCIPLEPPVPDDMSAPADAGTQQNLNGYAAPGQPCQGPNLFDCPQAHMAQAPVEPFSVPLKEIGLEEAPGGPQYVAVAVLPPFGPKEYEEAAAVAARKAGWPVGTALPPDAAVTIYGPPPKGGPLLPPSMKILYEAPPPGIFGMPEKAGVTTATIPPPEAVEASRKAFEKQLALDRGEALVEVGATTAHRVRSRLRGETTHHP